MGAALVQDIANCQSSLLAFAQFMFTARKGVPMKPNHHQVQICNALERVVLGQISRLVINVPPRSGKTELAVINFIAWAMGLYPDSEFIHASYSKRLATNNTYQVRALMGHEAYASVFGAPKFMADSNAKDEFRTQQGGVVYATGADGTITGYGAGKMRDSFGGAIIIDDPHKAQEGESEIMRNNVLDWFSTTLESRKNSPATPIILIMQRLHESDLSGFLVNGGNGEKWHHVVIPAEVNGTSFWEEQFPIADLHRMEKANAYRYAGQYLQRPAPLDGGLFKVNNLQVVDAVPAGTVFCRGWDLASTVDGDYTAGAKLGRLPDGRFVIADVVRGRWGPDERDRTLLNTASLDGKSCKVSIPQDPGQAGKTQALFLTRMLAGYPIKATPESGDKTTRATPLAAQVNAGNVLLLRGQWNTELLSELRVFPNGTHDDQTDACSRAFAELIARVSPEPQGLRIRGL